MAAPCYIAWNGATGVLNGALLTAVTTGTSTTVPKTMLQIQPATPKIRVAEWGYAFDAAPAAPVKVELIDTDSIACTVSVTGFVIHKYNDATGPASSCTISTSASGFGNAGAEGTVAASRLLGYNYDNAQYFKQQFPLGREPEQAGAKNLRIRVTMGSAAALNMICYIIWEE